MRSRLGTTSRKHGPDKFRALSADERRVVDAQLAALRAKRPRSFLRRVCEVRPGHVEREWKDARRSCLARSPRAPALYGVNVDAGRYADRRSLESDRRES